MTKYHSKQTIVNGIKFPSILEADRYQQLLLLLRAGEIANLKLQVEFVINQAYTDAETGERMRSVVYVADFVYFDMRTKRTVIEDAKGIETAVFKIKWRQAKELYPQYDWKILRRRDV
jgi:hypothetical protein